MNNRIELENVPALKKIGINSFATYRNKTTEQELVCHDHGSAYEICYLESGNQPYFLRTETGEMKKYDVCGGEIFITAPYEVHSTGNFRQMRGALTWIQLNADCPCLLGQSPERADMLRDALAGIRTHLFKTPPSTAQKLIEAFNLILFPDEKQIFRATQLLSLFILEIGEIGRRIPEEQTLSAVTLEAVTFIKNRLLSDELDIDAVSKKMNLSRSYAMRTFKRETGLPIHEYILKSRIELAQVLLKDHSILDTAMLLNFSSSQHFSSSFRGFTGMTPAQFRKNLTEKQLPANDRKT